MKLVVNVFGGKTDHIREYEKRKNKYYMSLEKVKRVYGMSLIYC